MRSRFTALAVAALTVAPVLQSQATFVQYTGNAEKAIVTQDAGVGGGINNPLYLPPATDNNYSGIVNLWFRNAAGVVQGACTGSLLEGGGRRKILTAGHCIADNSSTIVWSSFTARFRNADGTFTEVNGTGFAVQSNYSGNVVEEQDVAVLTLSADAPASARGYSLFTGNPLVDYTAAGFGRTGTGLTGDNNNANNQFGAVNVLRAGRNRFESTGNDAEFFAENGNPNVAGFGGVLLSDFDDINGSPDSFTCLGLEFCDNGFGLNEVAIGRGDSGGAALTNTWQVLGVASWGSTTDGISLSQYGTDFGYACVANFAANAACLANYRFVQAQLANVVPEPSTYALMATGLIGIIGLARRRQVRA
jgi:V8-like Glu-specific endopeptidase